MNASAGICAIKVGGGLARDADVLQRVGLALARAAARRPTVVIPGGGPFADQVRAFDGAYGLSASAAHWMAILAMDQFAYVVADHLPKSRLVETLPAITACHRAGEVPILAPARWLRLADELPHSWDVTSDSIAAYLATLIGAEELVLVKPVSGGMELVDPYFARTLPSGLHCRIVSVDEFLTTAGEP